MSAAIQFAYSLTMASFPGSVSVVNHAIPRSFTLRAPSSFFSNIYKLLRSSCKSTSTIVNPFQTVSCSCAAPMSNGVNGLETPWANGKARTQPSINLSLFLSWLSFCDRLCLFSALSELFLQNRGGIYLLRQGSHGFVSLITQITQIDAP
jgi:hypothetical protein